MIDDNMFFTVDFYPEEVNHSYDMYITCRLCGWMVDYRYEDKLEPAPEYMGCECFSGFISTESTESTGSTITTNES